MAASTTGYNLTQKIINVAGLLAFVALTLHHGHHFAGLAAEVPWVGFLVALAFLSAIVAADFASGLVHWAADNWGSGDWPIVGGFVQPFRHHHVEPQAMVEHRFLERFGDNSVAALPTFGFALLADGGAAWRVVWGAVLGVTARGGLPPAQSRAWAARGTPPRLVAWLQRWRIILSPAHHDVHHQAPYARHYCITTGWLNAPLERLRFFPALEALLTAVTGVSPLHAQRPGPEPEAELETSVEPR